MKKNAQVSLLVVLAVTALGFWSCNGIFGLFGEDDPPSNPYAGMTRFAIDGDGGTIEDESGLTLTVPASAVAAQADIYLRQLDPVDYPALYPDERIAPEDVLFTFRGEVDDGSDEFSGFDEPVTVSIPVPGIEPGDFIVIREFDTETGNLVPSSHSYTITYSDVPGGETIELELEHFCGLSAEVEAELKRAENECQDSATACRCNNRFVASSNQDYSIERVGDERACYFTHDYIEAQFLDCPGTPSESAEFIEISDVCEPNLTLTGDTLVIEPGETVNLETLFRIGNGPFAGKNVAFSITGPGTLNRSDDVTDASGVVTNTVTATETGEIVVTARGTGRYYLYEKIIKENDVIKEEGHRDPRDVDETATVSIQVIEKPELTLVAGDTDLSPGETTVITATVAVSDGGYSGQVINFVVSGPGTLSSTSGTTDESGAVSIILTAGDEDGTVTVTADSNVEIDLGGGRIESEPLMTQVEVTVAEAAPELWTGTLDYHYYYRPYYYVYGPYEFLPEGTTDILSETADYSITFQVTATPYDWAGVVLYDDIEGIATADQTVDIDVDFHPNSHGEYKELVETDTPSTIELIVTGFTYYPDDNPENEPCVRLYFKKTEDSSILNPDSYFYQFSIIEYSDYHSPYERSGGLPLYRLRTPLQEPHDTIDIPWQEEGTYTEEWSESDPMVERSYTLTLQRVE